MKIDNRTVELLKCATWPNLPSGTSVREYIVFENDEVQKLGDDCFFIDHNLYVRNPETMSYSLVEPKKYLRCYGFSIETILYLLRRKKADVLNVAFISDDFNPYMVITLISKNTMYPTAFRYSSCEIHRFHEQQIAQELFRLYLLLV